VAVGLLITLVAAYRSSLVHQAARALFRAEVRYLVFLLQAVTMLGLGI
jgi:hypothetical protein